MSYIPGEGTNVFPLESLNGSGITLTDLGSQTLVATALTAGSGITLTPSGVNKTITIAAPAGPAGITSITSANGSGITATNAFPNVLLTNALQAGSGISLTPSGINADLTIGNTATLTTPVSSGLTITGTAPNYNIDTALVGGAGISIVADPNSAQGKLISNTGVLSVNPANGSGLTVNTTTGNVVINNTNPVPVASTTGGGVDVAAGQVLSLNLVGGPGVSVGTGTGTAKTITNTGALSLTAPANSGISVSANTGAITITNSGVRTITAVAPIIASGSTGNVSLSLGPLTGGLKAARINVSATGFNFPVVPTNTGRINFSGTIGGSFYQDFLNATPISDTNGTWVVNLSSLLLLYPTNAPGTQSVALSITPGGSFTPAYSLPSQLFAIGSGAQYLGPGQVALPVNAIKAALGINTTPTLSIAFTNNFATGNLTRSSYNSVVYAVYYPNGAA